MVSTCAVFSRDSLSHGGIGVTDKFKLNAWGSFTENSFSEWNFTCQQGVLNIIWKELYGFQLKGIISNHWNICYQKNNSSSMATFINNSWQNEGLSMNLTYLCMGEGVKGIHDCIFVFINWYLWIPIPKLVFLANYKNMWHRNLMAKRAI